MKVLEAVLRALIKALTREVSVDGKNIITCEGCSLRGIPLINCDVLCSYRTIRKWRWSK
jgi:hypothetical protein